MTSIECIKEVKYITPMESIQEVMHMYELIEEHTHQLKDIIKENDTI